MSESNYDTMALRLITLPRVDGTITQELHGYNNDATLTLARWVLDSREKGAHDALVRLGWTPPNASLETHENQNGGQP